MYVCLETSRLGTVQLTQYALSPGPIHLISMLHIFQQKLGIRMGFMPIVLCYSSQLFFYIFLGSVMYETSPMEPVQVVGKLCHKHSSESVHLGKYTVHGDKVNA